MRRFIPLIPLAYLPWHLFCQMKINALLVGVAGSSDSAQYRLVANDMAKWAFAQVTVAALITLGCAAWTMKRKLRSTSN